MDTKVTNIGKFKTDGDFASAVQAKTHAEEGTPFTIKAAVNGKEATVICNPKEEGGAITNTVRVLVQGGEAGEIDALKAALIQAGLNVESASMRRERADAVSRPRD